jgi:hypothetical protein
MSGTDASMTYVIGSRCFFALVHEEILTPADLPIKIDLAPLGLAIHSRLLEFCFLALLAGGAVARAKRAVNGPPACRRDS